MEKDCGAPGWESLTHYSPAVSYNFPLSCFDGYIVTVVLNVSWKQNCCGRVTITFGFVKVALRWCYIFRLLVRDNNLSDG